jgi:hypothetical protein
LLYSFNNGVLPEFDQNVLYRLAEGNNFMMDLLVTIARSQIDNRMGLACIGAFFLAKGAKPPLSNFLKKVNFDQCNTFLNITESCDSQTWEQLKDKTFICEITCGAFYSEVKEFLLL